jgi:hypothetical protein
MAHTGESKIVSCPECGKSLHKRGLHGHMRFKHPTAHLRIEQTPAVAEDRATPAEEVSLTTRAQTTGRQTAEVVAQEPTPEPRRELAERRQGEAGWLFVGLLVLAVWAFRSTPERAISALETRVKKPIMGERHRQ